MRGLQSTKHNTARGRRRWAALLVALLTLALAVGAALLTGTGTGPLARGVESASFSSGALLGGLARALPLGYAFGAGMVASVNPCGFALLPAYLGLYLGTAAAPESPEPVLFRLLRAARVSGMMTLGFVLLFGVTGLVLSVFTYGIARYFPWLGLMVGVMLVLVAGGMLGGGEVRATVGERLAGRLGAGTRRSGNAGYLAYGVAYAAASLGCTLPIFLSVVASALTSGGWASGALGFVLYGLGMGAVIATLTLGTALLRYSLLGNARRAGRYVHAVGAILLLLLAGAYVVYYWLTLGGILSDVLA